MLFHASQIANIEYLEPRISNHNIPLVYFSSKKENTFVYLSNAVEKYCKETGYVHLGKWEKWGSYGFTTDGILRIEEYYPNATIDTYKGVSGYIYSTSATNKTEKLPDIPFAYISKSRILTEHVEYIPDAYDAIMEAVAVGHIALRKYEDYTAKAHQGIKDMILNEYKTATEEYKHFLEGKFEFISSNL